MVFLMDFNGDAFTRLLELCKKKKKGNLNFFLEKLLIKVVWFVFLENSDTAASPAVTASTATNGLKQKQPCHRLLKQSSCLLISNRMLCFGLRWHRFIKYVLYL